VGTPQDPLVVMLSPSHSPAGPGDPLPSIQEYLRYRTGMAVEVRTASSPMDAIEQLGARKADAGILSLDEYLLAREEYGVRAALQALRRDSSSEFEGCILVRADGPVQDVRGLSGRRFAFVDPLSVSGFILPAGFLRKEDVEVEPLFAGSHAAALMAVVDGTVSAAATFAEAASRAPGLKILAKTGTMPNEPLAFREGLKADKREAITAAFLSLGETPEGRAALASIADITGFRRAPLDAYRPAHDLLRSADKSVYDLIPEGWDIRKLNRPYLPD